jgi:drug/metabolite transporter (DMT)-like permease
MKFSVSRLDALLVLMIVIWGSNYSVIKAALGEIPPMGFNTLRLALAAVLFLVAIAVNGARGGSARRVPLTRRDWIGLLVLAFVGQFVNQFLFVTGLSMTSVANSALIIGSAPIFVALLSAALGHEYIAPIRWAGAALSAIGLYSVVGHGAAVTRETMLGDASILGAALCWAVATVGSRTLLTRHSPLIVTGYSIALGAVIHVPLGWRDLRGLAWASVSPTSWAALVMSATLALFVAYLIWFTAVQRLGNTRTSAYSNLTPVVAMIMAWLWIGERVTPVQMSGAAAILVGVALTRLRWGGEPLPTRQVRVG